MGLGRRLAAVLLAAGSVLVAAGAAGASTDPEVERDGRDSTSTTTTSTTATTTTAATTTSATTTAPVSTTSTTSSTVPVVVAGDAEQLPTFYLRGLCVTAGGAFVFAMSNLDTAPVQVDLVFNGQPFDTVDLDPGEVYGFRTDAPGTMVAQLPGASFQTESFDAPCPIAPGSIGMGGLCRDITTGYQWLLGNSGPDPVDVEVQLAGAVVGTFTVESGGFAGFSTTSGGQAEALVAGQVVAEASSSESPCVPSPVSFFATCFAPGQGYRWFVSNDQEVPIVVELRVGGATQAVLTLAPSEGRDVTTTVGGLGELLLDREIIASAMSEDLPCETTISLWSPCADAASGTWWSLSNGSPFDVAELRLVLNGLDFDVVTLQPGEAREFSTLESGTMEAFAGGLLVARGESGSGACVTISGVCVDTADGQVWGLEPMRPVVAEVRIGGVVAGTFDLRSAQVVQFASPLPGPAEVLIGETVVGDAEPSTDPCVNLFAECFDPANGYLFALFNSRDEQRTAELRIGGAARTQVLEPFGFVGFALPTPGPVEVYVDGQLVQTVEGSGGECEVPAVFVTGTCFSADGGYEWQVDSQRDLSMTVELRLNDAPEASVVLSPRESMFPRTTRPGTMQAFVNGVFVSEGESSSDPCFESPTTVGPAAQLPGTGGGPSAPLTLGMVSLVAGLAVLGATRRRRDHRTPVRS